MKRRDFGLERTTPQRAHARASRNPHSALHTNITSDAPRLSRPTNRPSFPARAGTRVTHKRYAPPHRPSGLMPSCARATTTAVARQRRHTHALTHTRDHKRLGASRRSCERRASTHAAVGAEMGGADVCHHNAHRRCRPLRPASSPRHAHTRLTTDATLPPAHAMPARSRATCGTRTRDCPRIDGLTP